LDIYEEIKWGCAKDSIQYKTLVEKEQIYKFLLGLNKDLDEVRGWILGKKPLPKVQEVFSKVRRKESRRKIMQGGSTAVQIYESSTLAAKGLRQNYQRKKSKSSCENCKKIGHTKDTCWFLHGKPP